MQHSLGEVVWFNGLRLFIYHRWWSHFSFRVQIYLLEPPIHLLTASTPRTPKDTTRTRVNRNVRANVRATVAPVEKDVTV